jgi:hypothetical protein
MVGKLPTLLTGAQKPNGRSNEKQNLLWIRKAKPRSGTKFRSSTQGAGCQKILSPQNRGQAFSLDIPFYRTCQPFEFRVVRPPGLVQKEESSPE